MFTSTLEQLQPTNKKIKKVVDKTNHQSKINPVMKNIKKLIITFAAVATVFTLFADTHKNHSLSRETKIVAITILAEARGEGEAGMYAVGAVIAQRAKERKQTPTEVCLKKWQFS